MRIPIARAAGCVLVGTELGWLPAEILVDRHLDGAERLLAGNDS